MNKKNTSLTEDEIKRIAELLRAMAHPIRLRMLTGLCRSECNVSRLWQELRISQPLASQHLNRMRRAGLVTSERRGQETCYHIADPLVEQLLASICEGVAALSKAGAKKRRTKS